MKRIALALALASVASVPGMAADLPSRAPPPVFVPPPPLFTWTGFYIGGVAGVQFASKHELRNPTAPLAGARNVNKNGSDDIGFTGGGEVGYNYQIGSIVIGVEGDADFIDRKAKSSSRGALTNNSYRVTPGKASNIFGTARARVGYAFDRLLIYATGGGAFTGGEGVYAVQFNPPGRGGARTFRSTAQNDTQVGFSVGGGIEYAIFGNWSVKGEYLFNSIGDTKLTFRRAAGAGGFTAKVDDQFSVARLGVNYRF